MALVEILCNPKLLEIKDWSISELAKVKHAERIGVRKSWSCSLSTKRFLTDWKSEARFTVPRKVIRSAAQGQQFDPTNSIFRSRISIAMLLQTQLQLQEINISRTLAEARRSEDLIEIIKQMFRSMEDGEISVSPYDTAWLALVPEQNGSAAPRFPGSLQWIIDNQQPDGSWGDAHIFYAYDRIVSTLACVISLRKWNVTPERIDRGLHFIQANISNMANEDSAHMPIGFEIIFPSLMEAAKSMKLDLSYDSTALQPIYEQRALKTKRIPMDILHTIPTTLLHSLEGLQRDVDWGKLMKLQSRDGSFLFSPSATAFAFMQTGDKNCLRYLSRVTAKFNGGAPGVYPVDLFEHLWAVDRLERLGIARHFESEIKDCLDYVYRYWTDKGIGWARNSAVFDADDTAMSFRLLRLHGYDVSADVFRHFRKDDQFFCIAGETNQAVTGMFNLYRACQILFPGESILEDAKNFSKKILQKKLSRNELSDKWIVSKDLVGEVEYALEFPWYSSQPRIEARMYIEQYGENDAWIAKTLYRMPYVNNKIYLELAKADFNVYQSIHRKELNEILSWHHDCGFDEFELHKESITETYFLAVTAIFEPEMSSARLSWARSAMLSIAVRNFFEESCFRQHKMDFITAFRRWDVTVNIEDLINSKRAKTLLKCLFRTIDQISLEGALAQGRDISSHLRHAWELWLMDMASTETQNDDQHSFKTEAEVIVLTAGFFTGEPISEDLLCRSDYLNLTMLTSRVCSILRRIRFYKKEQNGKLENLQHLAESGMQELVRCVVGKSKIPNGVKQMVLKVVKCFYYAVHCSQSEMRNHMKKVLFQPVQ